MSQRSNIRQSALCHSVFYDHNKFPETISLQRGKVYSGSVLEVQSMIGWPHSFGPMAAQLREEK
jgi:hypothetical protein